MDFAAITIFPEFFSGFFSCGMVRKAIEERLISCRAVDIRDFAEGRHRVTDDRPFGGGSGMVMIPGPLTRAIDEVKKELPEAPVVFLGPQGRVFDQKTALSLSRLPALILVCGRYEAMDERVLESRCDLEISIGDFVLSGGEPAAMVVMDAIVRLLPGVLGNADSAVTESFMEGLLDYPHFTRPRDFEGEPVPDELLSGNHKEIEAWRRETALLKTLVRRPDLFSGLD
ncbi:MAG: tRNA (guanosine(37)-N1)-methyltransferase TrmD, partial [Thermodesulfobacteriota bacterium]